MNRIDFLFKQFDERLTDAQTMRLLDIGNLDNQAKIHKDILKRFPMSEIHGLDIVDQKSLGLNFAHQHTGSFEEMDFPDNYFDAIYMGEVLEHTWKPKQVMDRCAAILKKGGIIILDTPNVYSLSRMIRYLFTGKDIILGNPQHTIFYSHAMLENLMEKSGFTVNIISTEVNFDTRTIKSKLPNIGTFKFMGECLVAVGTKK